MATATPAINSFTVSETNIAINVTAGTETSHVQWDRSWVDNGGGSNDLESALATGQSYTQNFTPPSTPGDYWVAVRARINSTASSWVYRYFTVSDPDPSIQSLSVTGNGTIEANWSVSNTPYMRSTNSQAVYLSGANNSTQHFMGYLGPGERSYSSALAGDGAALVVGATYTIWIYVYDMDANSFGVNRSVSFTRPRPANFNWTVAKTTGGQYNLTYSEWNGLLDKIDDFRAYKGLSQANFNRSLVSGALNSVVMPRASSFNAAVNMLNTMSPTIAAPSLVNSGQRITASQLNALRNSLNSIT